MPHAFASDMGGRTGNAQDGDDHQGRGAAKREREDGRDDAHPAGRLDGALSSPCWHDR